MKRARRALWAQRALAEIHRLIKERRVRFTLKAFEELALLDLGLDEEDALQILAELRVQDLTARVAARETDEWLYVFKPQIAGLLLYVKLIVREDCIVVSFHRDEVADEEF